MRFLHSHAHSTLNIPPVKPPVSTGADQLVSKMGASPIPTVAPGQCIDHIGMTLKGFYVHGTLNIPQEQFPMVTGATATGDEPPIGTPCHAGDPALMPRQLERSSVLCWFAPLFALPQVQAAIMTTTDQLLTVRTPVYTPERYRVCLSEEVQATCCRIPHLYSLSISPTSQLVAMRTPCHA